MHDIEHWYQRSGKKILYTTLGALGVYLFIKYLLPYTAPFIVAWIIASGLQIIVKWLHEKLQMKRGIATMLSMVTVLSAISWGLAAVGRKIFVQANNLYQSIPLYREEILETFNNISDRTKHVFSALPFNSSLSLEKTIDQLFQNLASFLGSFVSKGSINVVSKLPNILFLVTITFLAIFFMTRDYIVIQEFLGAQIPMSMREKSKILKNDLIGALGGYVRTQLILMCITTTVCLIGFLLLGVHSAILLAIIIGVVDALPIFGSGLFLVPWAIYNVILGKYSMAVGLGGIYALIIIVRQVVEPRILSTQIGVNTLVTIIAMYLGFRTMGVIGLVIGPVLVIVLQTLQKVGLLPAFKKID
ncbi:MAG TPA: sporulation integral membrane protein YtvI [Epulopiscium sp.]|nr:sporulation integral membrane protein YtvI [Candidatus Epulonipiscium sp.]